MTQKNIYIVRSIKYPNAIETGICNIFSSLKFFLNIIICSTIRKILNIIVKLPSVSGKLRLRTYGIDDIGDVPRLAFVTRLTPNALTNNPTKNNRYLFNLFIVTFPLSYRFIIKL